MQPASSLYVEVLQSNKYDNLTSSCLAHRCKNFQIFLSVSCEHYDYLRPVLLIFKPSPTAKYLKIFKNEGSFSDRGSTVP